MKNIIVLFLLQGLISSVVGQTNPLDVTFASDGELSLSFGTSNEAMCGVALLPDGRIMVAGASESNDSEGVRVARLFPDGSLDTSFGVDGMMELPASDFQYNYSVFAFTASDGDVLVLSGGWGGSSDSERVTIWKIDSEGELDPDYGENGLVTIPEFSMYWWYMWPIIETDGSIYLPGVDFSHPLDVPGLAVISPQGEVNMDFATDARLLLDGDFLFRMIRLQGGGWVFFGFGDTTTDNKIVRTGPNGEIDPMFGNDGVLIVENGFGDLIELEDGSLLMTRGSADGDLMRINPAGEPDITFGNVGNVDLPGEFQYYRFHRDFLGEISVWGSIDIGEEGNNYYFSRVNEFGYPVTDNPDSPDGLIERILYPPSLGQMVNQPDGRILLSSRSPAPGEGVKAYVARIDPALVVGVESADMESRSFLMSPNPCRAGDQLTMELSPDMVHDLSNVTLCSLSTGQKHDVSVIPFHAEAGMAFELPQVAAGVYVISVHTDSQSFQSRLVVME
jgi:uncharacterized delta-60 repeat protein